MSLRSAVFGLAFAFAGVLAFVFATLGTVVVLVDRNSGGSDGATPVTAASYASDQVAVRLNNEESGRGSSPVKARAYFLDGVPRH